MLRIAVPVLWALLSVAATAGEPRTIRVATEAVARTLSVDADGRLATTALLSGEGRRLLPLVGDQPEFALVGIDGSTLTAVDYRVVGHESLRADGAQVERLTLSPRQPSRPTVVVEYRATPGELVLRKRLLVQPTAADEWIVDRAEIERLAVGRVRGERGGFGQPLFWVGDAEHADAGHTAGFAGMEFPAGSTECVGARLMSFHHPGRAAFATPWAVVGAVPDDRVATGRLADASRVADAFDRYLDGVRRPARPLLIYNPWFDLRGRELNPDSLVRTVRQFSDKLLRPHGLSFDAVVVDDGWQEPRSCWSAGSAWPMGLAPLADSLGESGQRMGLWLPLNGYHLDTGWGRDQLGWELSDAGKGYCCLVGKTWNAAVRAAVAERIRESRLSLIKHDFNYLRCSADGHGHLPTERHGREANTAALLGLLDWERQQQPDIALVLTTGTWPSPWWLMAADAVWMGGHDYNRELGQPHRGTRDAEMTFRDAGVYQLLRTRATAFPASALMTHGIIRGRYEGLNPSESAEDWTDYLALFFGRGTQLHELYVSPELMPAEHWASLGAMLRWARAESATLAHTRMIGGRPDHGQLYAYVHWSAHRGLVCLRNPSGRPTRLALTLAERPRHLPSVASWVGLRLYPHRQRLSVLTAAEPLIVELPAYSVSLVELRPSWPSEWSAVPVGGRFDVRLRDGRPTLIGLRELAEPRAELHTLDEPEIGLKEWRGRYRLSVPADHRAELELTRRPGEGARIRVAVGEEELTVRTVAAGPGWDRLVYELPAGPAELSLRVEATLPMSPIWPQRAAVSAVLRVRGPAQEAWARPLPMGSAMPIWPPVRNAEPAGTAPAVSDPAGAESSGAEATVAELGGSQREWTLIDEHALTRPRRPAESLAWLLLIGVLPMVLLPGLAARLAARHWPSWAWPTAGLAAAALLVLARLSPWGAVLARCLAE